MSLKWTKKSQVEQKVGYKTITLKNFIQPNGKEAEYTTYGEVGADAVATIALTPDNQVIIARQFRPGPEAIFDELPGGGADGDDPAVGAARELREETGYTSDEPFELLGTGCRDAYTNDTSNYFLARNCMKTSEQSLDGTEFVEIDTISIEQLIKNAKEGRMSDAIAVLLAYDKLQAIRQS